MIGRRWALLGIVVTIGIVAEHCEGLTIPTVTVDNEYIHPPALINAGWPVAKSLSCPKTGAS